MGTICDRSSTLYQARLRRAMKGRASCRTADRCFDWRFQEYGGDDETRTRDNATTRNLCDSSRVRANRAGHLRIIDPRVHRVRFFRHRLQAGAIFALADLPNERPFRKRREHNLYPVLRGGSELQSLESVMV